MIPALWDPLYDRYRIIRIYRKIKENLRLGRLWKILGEED